MRMKKKREMDVIQRRFSLAMYLFVFAAFFYPWMMVGGRRYSLFSFAALWWQEGTEGVLELAGVPFDEAYGGGFQVFLILFLVYGILSVFYVAAVLLRKKWNINYGVLFVCVVIMFACREEYMCTPGKICENELEAALFPAVFLMGSSVGISRTTPCCFSVMPLSFWWCSQDLGIIPFAICEYAELVLIIAFLTEREIRRIERAV